MKTSSIMCLCNGGIWFMVAGIVAHQDKNGAFFLLFALGASNMFAAWYDQGLVSPLDGKVWLKSSEDE